METADAEHGKTKRDLAIKDAEISRLNQDLHDQQELSEREKESAAKLRAESSAMKDELKNNEKKRIIAEEKVMRKMQRILSHHRDTYCFYLLYPFSRNIFLK